MLSTSVHPNISSSFNACRPSSISFFDGVTFLLFILVSSAVRFCAASVATRARSASHSASKSAGPFTGLADMTMTAGFTLVSKSAILRSRISLHASARSGAASKNFLSALAE